MKWKRSLLIAVLLVLIIIVNVFTGIIILKLKEYKEIDDINFGEPENILIYSNGYDSLSMPKDSTHYVKLFYQCEQLLDDTSKFTVYTGDMPNFDLNSGLELFFPEDTIVDISVDDEIKKVTVNKVVLFCEENQQGKLFIVSDEAIYSALDMRDTSEIYSYIYGIVSVSAK